METKDINIAAILRDKPKNISLFDEVRGINVYLDSVSKNLEHIYCTGNECSYYYTNTGGFSDNYPNGAQILKPSKTMRDWSKFAWKKGDVLLAGVDNFCIFGGWANDDYTEFHAKFVSDSYSDDTCKTLQWTKVDNENIIKQYISNIEEIKGGKLNLETLEIEKPELKDGDVLTLVGDGKTHYKTILLYQSNSDDRYEVYSFLNTGTGYLSFEATLMDDRKARSATNSEKQQLFSALANIGKKWNPDTKQIEDLPKEHELKTLDYMLVRDKDRVLPMWQLYQYAHENENYIYIVGSLFGLDRERIEVLPYNDQTAHLLGTTDDYEEGGEA